MQILLSGPSGDVYPLEVPDSMQVADLTALAEAEAGLGGKVRLLHNGKALADPKATLKDAGLRDQDMIAVLPAQTTPAPAATPTTPSLPIDFGAIRLPGASSSASAASSSSAAPQRPAQDDPHHLHRLISADPSLLARIREGNPPLANAFEAGNFAEFARVFAEQMKEKREAAAKRARLLADPMSAEAQRLIEEEIAAANIDQNMSTAIEHQPEVFGTVCMLYIDCKVNGHSIKAFVDSGAQSTIMSAACAERCGLARLLDKRFQGIAKGVGTQKILGRVHMAQLEIAGTFLPSSFTILQDQPMEMLLGLDMLKRHQMCIDLKEGCLRIGTTETRTPFLAEAELPLHARLNGPDEEEAQTDKALAESTGGSARERLAAMGFDPVAAERELRAAGGDFETALAKLTGN